jgi:hypothetical protein
MNKFQVGNLAKIARYDILCIIIKESKYLNDKNLEKMYLVKCFNYFLDTLWVSKNELQRL